MDRVKTFLATGLAPDGRLYAGDLNAIEDAAAALSDFTQTLDLSVLRVGQADLQVLRYGAGLGTITSEARLTGDLRVDGVVRPLGGLILGAFTTTQRNAIGAGMAPYGIIILNTTTNQFEWNVGTDGARNWQSLGLSAVDTANLVDGAVTTAKLHDGAVTAAKLAANSVVPSGLLAARPAAGAGNDGLMYYATDQVALYVGIASSWVRVGPQAGDVIWTAESAARTGYVLAQGQAIARGGINADLFANWGTKFGVGDGSTTFNVADMQGRGAVSMAGAGGHADVTTIGNNDGGALANKRPKHAHTKTGSPSFTGGLQGGGSTNSGGSNSIDTSGAAGGANSTILGTLAVSLSGVTIGPTSGVLNDTAAYIVLHAQIKL